VVGSSDEATRRARVLVEAGGLVRQVEPAAFRASDLDGVWLCVLTHRDEQLARRIADATEERRIFFCAVDQPEYGSFSHLGIARAGDLCIAIGTEGKSPALSRRLREELERLLAESGAASFLERLAELRESTPRERRADVLNAVVARVRLLGKLVLPE
jgi:siroheme synthase-like protein